MPRGRVEDVSSDRLRPSSSSRVTTTSRTAAFPTRTNASATVRGAETMRVREPTARAISRTKCPNSCTSGPAASWTTRDSASIAIRAVSRTETGCTRQPTGRGMRNSGSRRRIHAMLLTRMSLGPKTSVGRTIAQSWSLRSSHCSIRCLPRKYARSSAASARDTEMCTIRRTPARRAASKRAIVRRTASSKVDRPRSNRIQYVL